MSFRKKISWLSLGGIILAFGPYFASLILTGGPPWTLSASGAGLFLFAVIMLTIVMTIGTIGVAVSNLKEAQQPSDERDRLVSRRASAVAYAILLPAFFCALSTLLFGLGDAALVSSVLAAIVLAEIVRCSTEIIGYRRGW